MNEDKFRAKQSGKLLYLDPNLTNSEGKNYTLINQQDMGISVELRTYHRNRSSLKKRGNEELKLFSETGSNGVITFVTPPTADPNGNKNLNTNYTNIHTTFTDETGGFGTQSLGITSINIDFDTSYTPQVTINFTDVRGASLFEAMSYYSANKKKAPAYASLFQMPYPIFELTIKGYYGKPVVYQLCLTDFKSSFNSERGNFDFTCKFIGYTYAFLSDMLIGYLRAIVYTKRGGEIFKGLGQGKYKLEGYAGENVSNLPTLNDFEKACNEINSAIEKAQSEDKSLNTNPIETKIEATNTLETLLNDYCKTLSRQNFKAHNPTNLKNIWVYTMFEDVDTTSGYYKTPANIKTMQQIVSNKKYANDLTAILNNIKTGCGVISDKLTDPNIFDKYLYGDKVVTYRLPNPDNKNEENTIVNNSISIKYNPVKFTLKDGHNLAYSIDLTDLKTLLSGIREDYQNDIKTSLEKKNEIADKVIKDSFSFKPSVKNIFKILLAHAETFMTVMNDLSTTIDSKSVDRGKLLKTKGKNLPDINNKDNNNILYAFPEYVIGNDETGYEEHWIGNDPELSKIDEVAFVEELLKAKIESQKIQEQNQQNLETTSNGLIQWIPIHPLDLPAFRDKHPYEEVYNSKAQADELFAYIVQRMFLANSEPAGWDDINNIGSATSNIDLTSYTGKSAYNKYVVNAKVEVNNILDKYKTDTTQLKKIFADQNLNKFLNSISVGNYARELVYSSIFVANPKSYSNRILPTNKYVSVKSIKDSDSIIYNPTNDKSVRFVSQEVLSPNNFFILEGDNKFDYSTSVGGDTYKQLFTTSLPSMNVPMVNVSNKIKDILADRETILQFFEYTTDKEIDDKARKFVGNGAVRNGDSVLLEKPVLGDTTFYTLGVRNIYGKNGDDGEERKSDLFFIDDKYLSENSYKRGLMLLSSLAFNTDISILLKNNYLDSGTIGELPKLYVLLIGAECYWDGNKNYNTEEIFTTKSLRGYFKTYFSDWVESEDGLKQLEKDLSGYVLKDSDYIKTSGDDKHISLTASDVKNRLDNNTYIKSFESQTWDPTNRYYATTKFYYYSKYVSDLYINRLKETVYLINNFYTNSNNQLIKNNFRMLKENVERYLNTLKDGINQYLTEQEQTESNQQALEAADRNNPDVKLALYSYLKNINDKWVGNQKELKQPWLSSGGINGVLTSDLIDRFQFLDRAYNMIGDKLFIKPEKVLESMTTNPNQSLVDVLSRVLASNNINFIALPSFFNYKNLDDLKDVFRIYDYNESQKLDVYGPSFVCMYVGKGSKHLDLGDYTDFQNDGFDIELIGNGDDLKLECGAKDFTSETLKNTTTDSTIKTVSDNATSYIPAFGVNIGQQNQSIFTNPQFNMEQYSETEESLYNTDDIAKKGAKKKSFIGQNLFNVYTARSYETGFDMAGGNAQIQPMMYYQLNYMPMYHGVYLIKKVSHALTPNTMSTSVKGQRVRRWATPLISNPTMENGTFADTGGGYYGDSGTTQTQEVAVTMGEAEIARANKFITFANNNSQSVIDGFYKPLYERAVKGKSSELPWRGTNGKRGFMDMVEKIAKEIKTQPSFLLFTLQIECGFNRFDNPGRTKTKPAWSNRGKSAGGFNQIIADPTLLDIMQNAGSLFRNEDELALLDKIRNVCKGRYNFDNNKKLFSAIDYSEAISLSAVDNLVLMGVFFKRAKQVAHISKDTAITNAITQYVLNLAPATAKGVNKNLDSIVYDKPNEVNENEGLSVGGVITGRTIAYRKSLEGFRGWEKY